MQMRENLVDFVACQHERLAHRSLRPFHPFQPSDLLFQDSLVEKEQRTESLVLGGRSDLTLSRQMGQEGAHLFLAQVARMPLSMEADESLDPIAIGVLRAEAIMLQAQPIVHLFEQLFRLARRSGLRYNPCGHERVFIRHLPGKQTDYTDFICL